jgi:hypothetical protein
MTAQPCQTSRALSHVATTATPRHALPDQTFPATPSLDLTAVPIRRLAQPNHVTTYPNMTYPTLTAKPNPAGPNHAIPDRAAPNQDRHAPLIQTVPNRT